MGDQGEQYKSSGVAVEKMILCYLLIWDFIFNLPKLELYNNTNMMIISLIHGHTVE